MKTIGILLDRSVFRRIKFGKTGNEKLSLYNRAARKLGLIPVYMCLEHLTPSSKTTYAYTYVNGRYVYGSVPVPRVIHNRTLPASKRMRARLARWTRRRLIFNAKNRYSKYRIHKLLRSRFSSRLPTTVPYTKPNLRRMMNRYDNLFLKPRSSSVGKGILNLVRRSDGRWKVRSGRKSTVVGRERVGSRLNALRVRGTYLIQRTIPLAKYKGRPYDIRVTVQRGDGGRWRVTGMFGKVAGRGKYVTNVARGGSARSVGPLLRHSFRDPSRIANRVRRVSLDIARELGARLNRLADVGLDIGVDAGGKPYFIEMNGRDQRYGFMRAKMPGAFYKAYETPIRYASYLLRKRRP